MPFISNELSFKGCFLITPSRIRLESNTNSLIKIIEFTIKKDFQGPRVIQGHVIFGENRTIERIFVLGAEKVEIAFAGYGSTPKN